MHITASWGGAEVEVEVGEECRSLAALKHAVCSALPEGVDGEKVCLEVGGRAVEEEDVLALSEGGRVDAVPTLAVRAADALREEGRAVDVDGFVAATIGEDLRVCGLYLDAGVVCSDPLHMAVRTQRIEVCTLLLDRGGGDAVSKPNHWGDTPLHVAVQQESTELCTLLLDCGADVHAKNYGHYTPLEVAVKERSTELCTLLLDRGSALSYPKKQRGALHLACRTNSTQCCTLLLDRGADPNAKNEEGETPLHEGVRNKHIEVCRLLLDRGADVKASNDYAETPLHLAVLRQNTEVGALLLARGADVYAENDFGDTPLDLAVHRVNKELYTLLIARGAAVNQEDTEL